MRLLLAFVALFSGGAHGEESFVPEKARTQLELPYRLAFVNRFEKSPELPPLFTDMIEKEVGAFLKLGLGPLAALEQDAKFTAKVRDALDAKGIERLTAQDLPPCPFDRLILADIRKDANLFEIRLREAAPQDARLSPVIRIATLHPRKIALLYATAAAKNFSLEGYVADFSPAGLKVLLRGEKLVPAALWGPNARLVFQIVEMAVAWGDEAVGPKVIERRLLPWWFVERTDKGWRLVGQDFQPRADTNDYRVCYKLFRIQLQGGSQRLRLVSYKDPDRWLSGYSVLAAHTPDMDTQLHLAGVSDENGEVVVTDREGLPLYVNIKKQGVLVIQKVLLVQPQAGTLEIPLPEFHPNLPELAKRLKDLESRVAASHTKYVGAVKRASESVSTAAGALPHLTEAETARTELLALDGEIKTLEQDAARIGADLAGPLAQLKSDYARRVEKLEDIAALRAKAESAAQTVTDAARSAQAEEDARSSMAQLKWEEAVRKYEEALRLAPADQKARIQQRLDAAKPKDTSHAAARTFVRDELPLFDERAASARLADIEKNVNCLAEAGDLPFKDAALKTINELSQRLVTAADKTLKEAEQNPATAAEKAGAATKMVEASKALDALNTRLAPGTAK